MDQHIKFSARPRVEQEYLVQACAWLIIEWAVLLSIVAVTVISKPDYHSVSVQWATWAQLGVATFPMSMALWFGRRYRLHRQY